MVGNLTELKEQLLQFWDNFSKKAKIIISVSTIVAFLGLLILVNWASRPDYTVLFNNLSSEDAGNIVNRLQEQQVDYKIQNNGSAILVPRDRVHQLRLDLASNGLPSGGVTGFEIFDQTQIGSTDFEQRVNYYRALSGELTRTVRQMENVNYAKVQVTPSQDSIYSEQRQPAKASVMLQLSQYQQLSTSQIRSITNLVASSVETLNPQNVTVVDTAGNLLSAQLENQGSEGDNLSNQLEIQNQLESTMEEDLNVMLTKVLGLNNFVVKVNANLNFNQRNVTSEEYEPVVDDQGVVRSRQTQEESQQGTTTSPEGVPGTTSNIPQYQESSQQQQQSQSQEEIVNYEINKEVEEFVKAQGNVERLSVSVMVNEELAEEQQEQIRQAVATAVGYNQGRGDQISVIGMQFDDSLEESTTQAQQQLAAQNQQRLYLIIGAIVAALALGYFLYRRSKSGAEQEAAEEIDYTVDDSGSEQAATTELSEEEQAKREMRQELQKLAEEQPEEIAELVRSWISEE